MGLNTQSPKAMTRPAGLSLQLYKAAALLAALCQALHHPQACNAMLYNLGYLQLFRFVAEKFLLSGFALAQLYADDH